jgi:hypothetical protein
VLLFDHHSTTPAAAQVKKIAGREDYPPLPADTAKNPVINALPALFHVRFVRKTALFFLQENSRQPKVLRCISIRLRLCLLLQ